MGLNRYDKDCLDCAQTIYARIAAQHPAMISEGFTVDAIQKILEMDSLIFWSDDENEEVEKIEKRNDEPFFSSDAAKAPRIRVTLAEKFSLAPLTRLGIYYVLEINSEICSEEVVLWLSHETPSEDIIPDFGGDQDRLYRYTHLELLKNTSAAMGNEHVLRVILHVKQCMESLAVGQYSQARLALRLIYPKLLSEQGKHPIHIETLQYCAELLLDCGEPVPALKCFLRFACRIREEENFIHKQYLGIYKIIKNDVEVELDSSRIAELIARFSKVLDKQGGRRRWSLYNRLKKKVPLFGQKFKQWDEKKYGSKVRYN